MSSIATRTSYVSRRPEQHRFSQVLQPRDFPVQFNPVQFNPVQFNPVQFNPVQFNFR